MKIYLAGPSVFAPDPIAAGEALKALCASHGRQAGLEVIGLYPMDNTIPPSIPPPPSYAAARWIREANMAMIRQCDAVVADLRPFRGPSMDVGTAYEMGVAEGLGKVVVGYTADTRGFAEKVEGVERMAGRRVVRGGDGMLRDEEGWAVEDFEDGGVGGGGGGMVDNLMVVCGVERLCWSAEEAIGEAVRIWRERQRLIGGLER